MKRRLSSALPLIIIGLLAAATFWLDHVVRNERPAGLGQARHEPDAVVERFQMDRFDKTGKLVTHLDAAQLMHYPDDDSSDIVSPVVTFTSSERPLRVSSRTARLTDESSKIVMTNDVRAIRPSVAGSTEQTLSTEELTVLTDDEIARTDKRVTMEQGGSRIVGTGAEWDNATGILRMGQVRAEIPPKR